ncbi:MAG: flagellar assembly protein FliW [Candidatus Aureabacteria bacterium]|nr:flagellar assembly protein FliW [Candidatus Auribacterota bacterium]
MKVNTTRFAEIDVPEDKIINFVEGIIGFSQLKQFVVIKHRNSSTMYWLQSLENPEIAFLMMFPFNFIADYSPELSEKDLCTIDLSPQEIRKAETYTMTYVPKDPQDMTVNLLSPIVINPDKGLGKQVILENSQYTVDFKVIREIQKKCKEQKSDQEQQC